MLVIPNYTVFLATPRTGSRAIINALRTLKPAFESREHHVHPEDVETEVQKLSPGCSCPYTTIIREPYDQVLSWFGHAVLRHEPKKHTIADFEHFIRETSIAWYFHDSLNPYLGQPGYQVRPFVFNKKNLQKTLSHLCGHLNSTHGTQTVTAPKLTKIGGAFSPSRGLLNATTTRLIEKRFPRDIELWRQYGDEGA